MPWAGYNGSMPEKKFEITPSVAIIVAGCIVAGAIVFTNTRAAEGPAGLLPTAGAAVNVAAPGASDHLYGSPDAPIKLIEYSDFECPFCSLVHPTLKRIVDESNGGVAWIYRHLPLESIHPKARPAALAAECVAEQLGNTGFWQFADTIFANQNKLSDQYMAGVAAELGADMGLYTSCTQSQKHAGVVDTHAADAMQNGGNGTPFTVVYGKGKQVPASGALPYDRFMAVINSL